MSLFMGGGELGRTVGPLLAVWAVSTFTLRGIIPLAVLGWLASLILWVRLNNNNHASHITQIQARPFPSGSARFFTATTILIFLRGLIITGLSMYLPTFMTGEGSNLWTAGSTLAIYQLFGSLGALAGGTISDRFGRLRLLAITMGGSSLLLLLFLTAQNWLSLPILMAIGFLNLTTQPVMLALIQDRFPDNRSMANGIYMGLSFIAFSATTILVGALGDWIGLRSAFFWVGLCSLIALPVLLFLRTPAQTSERS
jgi:FSR family fosmidomycin resistance protein-like MFS transporter